MLRPFPFRNESQRIQCGRGWSSGAGVRFWHKADMLNPLTNVCFRKAVIAQPLLTKLDL